jgi:hypothetical protein
MNAFDLEERDQLLEALDDFPDTLQDLIDAAEEPALTKAGPGGGWGVVEILCHLRDWEEVFGQRLRRMLREDAPKLEPVEDSLWPIQRDYVNQDPYEVLEEFGELREQSVDMLERVSQPEWARLGHHPQRGRVSVGEYAQYMASHDLEHLQQIIALIGSEPPVSPVLSEDEET